LVTPPTRSAPARRTDLLRVRQAIACFVALAFLLVSLSAEAKKKKAAKKGKTPSSKVKSKGTDRGLPPPESAPESDEETSDEKPAAKKKPAVEDDNEVEKKPTPPPSDEEALPVEPAPKKKPAKAPPPKAEGEGEGGALPAFTVGVGGKALFRNLSWTDSMNMVAPYSLAPGPEVAAWLEAYPAAFATDGFAGNIGLIGKFDYGFGASSKTMSGTTLTTKYQDFLAGLKIRIPLGSVIPYVVGAYGMQKFHLEPAAPERPNVNYSLVHGGAGVRVQATPELDVDLSAGYLYILNPGKAAGEVGEPTLYPKTTGFGIDAALSVGYRLTSLIGVRVGGDLRRIGLNTHRKSTDPVPPLPTGGALDQYITAWGGVEVVLDGMGGGAAHEGEGEAPPAKKPAKAKKPAPQDVEPEETPDKADSKGEDE
jgi:hypothetical protein